MNEAERRAASEKYYQDLRKKLDERIRSDKQLQKIAEKVANKTADFNDTAKYSEIASNHLANVLQENIGEINSPLAKEYVCKELLKDQHSAINELFGSVQVSIDEQNGIHIKTQKPAFPQERVDKVAHALEDPTVSPKTTKRRAGAPVANVSKSFHDDCVKKNATFRNDAGLTCYIIREGSNCCEWCSSVAGKYKFGTQPDDIFRRHDNCDCTIIYDGQVLRGKRNADGSRSKTWEEVPNADSSYSPTVLSPEEAERLQAKNQPKILTNGAKINNSSIDISSGSGIMRDNKTGIVLNTELYQGEVKLYDITQDRINHISDVELSSLSAENNQKLVQGCKDLLDYMNEVPLGCEGSIVFNMDMVEIDRYRSEITNSSLPAKTYSSECIVLHNHPSDTLFSDSDLQRFYEHDEYKILGAVGHNGSLYFAEKLPDYDMYGFWDYLEESKLQFPTKMSEEDIVKYVENVMKGAEEYGVKFYTKIYS